MAVMEEAKATTLSPVEWLAVKIVGKHADKYRDAIKPGRCQKVDLLLRIQGTIDVSEDTTATVQEKPKLDNLLGHVLKRLTPSDWEQIQQELLLLAKQNGGVLPGVEEGFAARADNLVQLLSKKKQQPRKGITKGQFRVGQVDQGQLTVVASNAVQKSTRQILLEEPEDSE